MLGAPCWFVVIGAFGLGVGLGSLAVFIVLLFLSLKSP
jgi:hypothetical protein